MKGLLAFISVLAVVAGKPAVDGQVEEPKKRTMHVYVLLVPDTAVETLTKARQEEEGAAALGETGLYVGQIISGVLGGDVRPIFAGSVSFIDEAEVQQGVGTILANVAPSLNTWLKNGYMRFATYWGLATTPRPQNGTAPSNGQIQGQPLQANNIPAQQQQQAQPGSVIFNNNQQQQPQSAAQGQGQAQQQGQQGQQGQEFEIKTAESLPILNPLSPDEDDDSRAKVALA